MPPSGFVPRDPGAQTRTRRALGNVAAIINALIASGDIVLTGPGEWRLVDKRPAPVVFFPDAGEGPAGPPGPPGPPGADGSGTGGVLPLVNGDLPGPGIMSDGNGQCIAVPLE